MAGATWQRIRAFALMIVSMTAYLRHSAPNQSVLLHAWGSKAALKGGWVMAKQQPG